MRHFQVVFAAIACLLILSGCAGKAPTMNYHRLAPMATVEATAAAQLPELTLGVGPITIPEMLKRQEIVIRRDDTNYRLTELHRWAGLLEKDLTRVIAENLGHLLGTVQIASHPWANYFAPDFRVTVAFLELTGSPEQQMTLRAIWTILDKGGEKMLVRRISEYSQQPAEQSVNSMIQAQSQVLGKLCQEISSALRELEKQ